MGSSKRLRRGGVKLENSLTVDTVAEARAHILAVIPSTGDLHCDASAVLSCDTAGIQLLCSASATMASKNARFVLTNATDVIVRSANRVGVEVSKIGIELGKVAILS